MTPTRYFSGPEMTPAVYGDYVAFDEYQKLATELQALRTNYDRLFDVTKRYCDCEHPQIRGQLFTDMAGTVNSLEGNPAYGWPQCYERLERGLRWVVEKLRTHHSARPGINTICQKAERCLKGFEIDGET